MCSNSNYAQNHEQAMFPRIKEEKWNELIARQQSSTDAPPQIKIIPQLPAHAELEKDHDDSLTCVQEHSGEITDLEVVKAEPTESEETGLFQLEENNQKHSESAVSSRCTDGNGPTDLQTGCQRKKGSHEVKSIFTCTLCGKKFKIRNIFKNRSRTPIDESQVQLDRCIPCEKRCQEYAKLSSNAANETQSDWNILKNSASNLQEIFLDFRGEKNTCNTQKNDARSGPTATVGFQMPNGIKLVEKIKEESHDSDTELTTYSGALDIKVCNVLSIPSMEDEVITKMTQDAIQLDSLNSTRDLEYQMDSLVEGRLKSKNSTVVSSLHDKYIPSALTFEQADQEAESDSDEDYVPPKRRHRKPPKGGGLTRRKMSKACRELRRTKINSAKKGTVDYMYDATLDEEISSFGQSSFTCPTSSHRKKPDTDTVIVVDDDDDEDEDEDATCPICDMEWTPEEGDYMICCDGCDKWYHWECVELEDEPPQKQKWFCPPCVTSNVKRKIMEQWMRNCANVP